MLYVVLTFFIWFGPKDVFRIASGVIFGAEISTIYITIAETVNAILLFMLSRIFGREYIEKKFKLT